MKKCTITFKGGDGTLYPVKFKINHSYIKDLNLWLSYKMSNVKYHCTIWMIVNWDWARKLNEKRWEKHIKKIIL